MSTGLRGHHPRNGQRQTTRAGESQGIGLTEGDLQCPICMSILADPFVTACGHSFCHACLSKHLAQRKTCPSCSIFLTLDRCFPNFALQQVMLAHLLYISKAQSPLFDVPAVPRRPVFCRVLASYLSNISIWPWQLTKQWHSGTHVVCTLLRQLLNAYEPYWRLRCNGWP